MKPTHVYCMRQLMWVAFLSFMILSCSSGDQTLNEFIEEEELGYPNVDRMLWPYFSRFEEESAARGIAIDLRALRITGEIEDLEGERVAGQCSFNHRQPNHITIDERFWQRSSENFREMIMFHELGHCVLYRGHLETELRNGACSSIMRSGNGGCIDNYNTQTRRFYVDELFENRSFPQS